MSSEIAFFYLGATMNEQQALIFFAEAPGFTENQVGWAKSLAAGLNLDLKESFLDPDNVKLPIFGEYLASTLIEFNEGLGGVYKQEHIDVYGKRLAEILNQRTSRSTSRMVFDDDGDVEKYEYEGNSDSETKYIYKDGTVSTVKGKSSWADETEVEVSGGDVTVVDEEAEEDFDVLIVEDDTDKDLDGAVIENDDEKKEDSSQADPVKKENSPAIEKEAPEQNVSMVQLLERVQLKSPDQEKTAHRFVGKVALERAGKDGSIQFKAPLFVLDALTANGNRYTRECAESIVKDVSNVYSKRKRKSRKSERSMIDVYRDPERVPDMLAQHDGRFGGSGNALLERCGIITKAKIEKLDNQDVIFVYGETIPTTAGKDISVQLEKSLIVGVSLVGLPVAGKYHENEDGGHDVDRMHFLGADFTDEPANYIQFRKASASGIQVLS